MTEPTGYYICYEDTDSRVLPYYPQTRSGEFFRDGMEVDAKAPYETELEAQHVLLQYFKNLRNELEDCVVSTETEIRMLEKENK